MAMLAILGTDVVLARDLVAEDIGTFPFTVTATENGVSVHAVGSLIVTKAVVVVVTQTPTALSLNPAAPTLPDDSKAGMLVSSIDVTTSDGSPFGGSLSVDGPA